MRIKEKIEILYSGYGLKSAIKEYDNKNTTLEIHKINSLCKNKLNAELSFFKAIFNIRECLKAVFNGNPKEKVITKIKKNIEE